MRLLIFISPHACLLVNEYRHEAILTRTDYDCIRLMNRIKNRYFCLFDNMAGKRERERETQRARLSGQHNRMRFEIR